jgi:hypothetical protein
MLELAERDPPGFIGPALSGGDVRLELHRISTRVGDRVNERVRGAQAAVVRLANLTDYRDAVIPVEYSHATRSPRITNG